MADTHVPSISHAHSIPAEGNRADSAVNLLPKEPQNLTQNEADPDSGYLAHIAWQPDIRDLTDPDLLDCLRGSVCASRLTSPSSEARAERLALIAELKARNFPADVIEAVITIGGCEGQRLAERRVADHAAAVSPRPAEAHRFETNQYAT